MLYGMQYIGLDGAHLGRFGRDILHIGQDIPGLRRTCGNILQNVQWKLPTYAAAIYVH